MDEEEPATDENELVVLDTHRLYPAGRIIHIFDITSSTSTQHKQRGCCGGDQGPSDFLSVWAGVPLSRRCDGVTLLLDNKAFSQLIFDTNMVTHHKPVLLQTVLEGAAKSSVSASLKV
jgi:hypothetical protein